MEQRIKWWLPEPGRGMGRERQREESPWYMSALDRNIF
jgi:hypothetical protein